MFIKLDLRWSYNNVRIKKGNEWKVIFTTLERLFELTVMFFGLINSLATFQAIINKTLRNLINTGKITSFINYIIVETESKKEDNELVENILKIWKKIIYI